MINRYMYANVLKVLLYIFFIVTSYVTIFKITFMDDLIVMAMIVMQILFITLHYKKIKRETAITMLMLVVISAYFIYGNICKSNGHNFNNFFVYFKIIVFMIQAQFFEFDGIQKNIIMRKLVIISIPNIIYSFYEILCTYVRHTYLPGKYNSSGMYRLQGMTGHPLFYSLILVVVLMYLLYYTKGVISYLCAGIVFCFCMLTWSSLAQVAAILLVGYKFYQYTKVKGIIIKNIGIAVIIVLSGMLAFIFLEMIKETYTIRYISVVETLKNINYTTISVGAGFGAYTANGLSESYIFHIMYDVGLLGLGFMLYILGKLIKKQIKKQNYAGTFIICLYFVNMVINEGYMIPFIALIPILSGEQMMTKKKI